MRNVTRIPLGVAGVVGVVVAAAPLGSNRRYEVPEPALRASTDSAVIARGRYLAYGPAHCASCHVTAEQARTLDAGARPPLSGGYAFHLPVGTIWSPNLTPDRETGIGRYSDGQLARMLRHNVRPDGRVAAPFMNFQGLSDADIVALISFLRSQPAVRNAVPDRKLNYLGKLIVAYLVRPRGPSGPTRATAPGEAPTIERGEYLANYVAECVVCHTKRSLVDGSERGSRFAGGMEMRDEAYPALRFTTPNLTPDPKTGHITGWTEDRFVARFQAGKLVPGTHMPWAGFAQMSEADLRAIYRYLRSLPPVENATGPTVRRVAE
ncbi:MAG: c-type cytochrome [Gemmatimonadetes bacterium]|nr:c-type cytochrome [Gemmatimonadota bacterium]